MVQQFVKASQLSCLMNGNVGAERYPEPFRMQADVAFYVTYSEYISYISLLTESDGISLMTPIEELVYKAMTNQPDLYKHFLWDLSFAMVKEISFAEQYRRPATLILPESENNPVKMRYLVDMHFSNCNAAKELLLTKCNQKGFPIQYEVSAQNRLYFQTAIVLYYLSMVLHRFDELNVVYG